MISDYEEMMGWTVALLAIIAIAIAFDYFRCWWRARTLHKDLELKKTEEDLDWHDSHYSLRREK
jgi:hypothetical protein